MKAPARRVTSPSGGRPPRAEVGGRTRETARNLANPMAGCRVQQTCAVPSGASRRSWEEQQGRNMHGSWQTRAEGGDSRVAAGSGRLVPGLAEGRIFGNPKRGSWTERRASARPGLVRVTAPEGRTDRHTRLRRRGEGHEGCVRESHRFVRTRLGRVSLEGHRSAPSHRPRGGKVMEVERQRPTSRAVPICRRNRAATPLQWRRRRWP